MLTWDNALVVEPAADDHDIEYVLEFANAQLLELRAFDAMLDAELPKMYHRWASDLGQMRLEIATAPEPGAVGVRACLNLT